MFKSPSLQLSYSPPIVDGDMGVILVHAGPKGGRGGSIVDIFRLKNGKIVEHWDVNQATPAHAVNPHPLF